MSSVSTNPRRYEEVEVRLQEVVIEWSWWVLGPGCGILSYSWGIEMMDAVPESNWLSTGGYGSGGRDGNV